MKVHGVETVRSHTSILNTSHVVTARTLGDFTEFPESQRNTGSGVLTTATLTVTAIRVIVTHASLRNRSTSIETTELRITTLIGLLAGRAVQNETHTMIFTQTLSC